MPKESFHIQLEDCEILELPNLFTPNGDGINDRFVAKKVRGITSTNLEIFNRWGQKRYQTNDLKIEGWDGSDTSNGVYFWVLHYTNFKGEEKVKTGVVKVSG